MKTYNDGSFLLYLEDNPYTKGQIFTTGNMTLKILKYYKENWWRKILIKLGFNIKINCYRVIGVENLK